MAQSPATPPVATLNRISPELQIGERTVEIKRSALNVAPTHLPFLDGLRALAAIFVVWHHCWLQVWPMMYHKAPPGILFRTTGWLYYGHYAVALFIVLSGYSLMLSVVRGNGVLRGGIKTFFARRARRILPPYYFALALSLLLIGTLIGQKTGTHWDASLPVTAQSFWNHILLLQDIQGAGPINHVFWSIAVEWHYYLLFPLLVFSWRKVGGWLTLLLAIAVSTIGSQIVHYPTLHEALFPFFTLFVFGMFGATVCFDKNGKWPLVRDRIPWLPLAALFAPLAIKTYSTRFFHWSDYLFGFACMALLIGVGRAPQEVVGRILGWKPLAFLGGFSYSLYLVHAPLIQVFWQYALRPLHLSDLATLLALILAGTPIFIACAYLFHLCCERPFMTTPQRKTT